MTSTATPKPLERGKAYYILVRGGDPSRGGHYGTGTFSIDQEGHVGPGPPPDLNDVDYTDH
jgi:hypothetical protein